MTTAHDRANGAPLFVEFRPAMRSLIEDVVESLLLLLDEIDGDADLEMDDHPEEDDPAEDDGDADLEMDDHPEEDDPAEDDGDAGEPSLGATEALNQCHAWRDTAGWIAEYGEAEPSLGWTGHGRGHPERALRGYDDDREENIGADDREHDEADRSGCGDMDGVLEQHGRDVSYAE